MINAFSLLFYIWELQNNCCRLAEEQVGSCCLKISSATAMFLCLAQFIRIETLLMSHKCLLTHMNTQGGVEKINMSKQLQVADWPKAAPFICTLLLYFQVR